MDNKKRVDSKGLAKILKKNSIVALVLPKSFNSSQGLHPVEEFFRSKGVVYYVEHSGMEKTKDYVLDLNKIEIKGI